MNDSQACSKEVLQVSLTVFLSQSWSLNSIDIKSAFLQVKEINRQVSHQKILLEREKYGYRRKLSMDYRMHPNPGTLQ